MTVLQRIVLVIASVIAAVGMLAIVWRELVAPIDAPGVSRARLAIEVLLPDRTVTFRAASLRCCSGSGRAERVATLLAEVGFRVS